MTTVTLKRRSWLGRVFYAPRLLWRTLRIGRDRVGALARLRIAWLSVRLLLDWKPGARLSPA